MWGVSHITAEPEPSSPGLISRTQPGMEWRGGYMSQLSAIIKNKKDYAHQDVQLKRFFWLSSSEKLGQIAECASEALVAAQSGWLKGVRLKHVCINNDTIIRRFAIKWRLIREIILDPHWTFALTMYSTNPLFAHLLLLLGKRRECVTTRVLMKYYI